MVQASKVALDFLGEVSKIPGSTLCSAYLFGPAAAAEFAPGNPGIDLVLIFASVNRELLDGISRLGRKFGAKGVRAPAVITKEYVANAGDVFPVELLELSKNSRRLAGERCFEGAQVSRRNLRLQCERELRYWRMGLRHGYIKAAGDTKWMSEWFKHHAGAFFPVLRAVVHLLGGEAAAGNAETARRLASLTGIDTSPFDEIWEARRSNRRIPKDRIGGLFDRLDAALGGLSEKVDGIE